MMAQRELLICPLLHFVFSFGSTVGVVPFSIQKVDNGFRLFTPTEGIRKWATKSILFFMVIRGLLMIPVGFSSRMKWTVNGFLTADLLFWLIGVAYASFWIIMSLLILFKSKEYELLYNGIVNQTKRFRNDYMGGQNILERKGHLPLAVFACYMAAFSMAFTPVMAGAMLTMCTSSPLAISYYVVGTYAASQTDTLHSRLFWCCLIVDWVMLTYAIWLVLWCLTVLTEGLALSALVFKEFRNSPHVPWIVKVKYHAEGELLLKIFNDVAATAIILAMTLGVMLISTCNTVLVKMDLEKGFPPVGCVPGVCILATGATITGFLFLKFAGSFREESIGLQKELEAEITAYFKMKAPRRQCFNNAYRPTGRIFRRRPFGIRFGSFMYIDDGMSVTYMMQIQDNTVNLVFMVDLWSVPMLLV